VRLVYQRLWQPQGRCYEVWQLMIAIESGLGCSYAQSKQIYHKVRLS
jgi:hypothetical protein